jgi:hypothetical protein
LTPCPLEGRCAAAAAPGQAGSDTYIGGAAFGKTPLLSALLSGGQLLLISATLSGTAVGELFGGGRKRRSAGEVFVGGVSIFVALLAAFSFALITTALSENIQPNARFVAIYSSVLFLLSVASGAGCVALSER